MEQRMIVAGKEKNKKRLSFGNGYASNKAHTDPALLADDLIAAVSVCRTTPTLYPACTGRSVVNKNDICDFFSLLMVQQNRL